MRRAKNRLTFTFMMDFRGGRYISQAAGSSLENALIVWVKTLEVKEIEHFGEKSRAELSKELIDEKPTPLEGLLHAWCMSFRIRKGLILLNIVQTEI